jgi:hypothetical protein
MDEIGEVEETAAVAVDPVERLSVRAADAR